MVLCNSAVIDYTSSFLNSSPGKCSNTSSGELCLCIRLNGSSQELHGFATILETIVQGSKSPLCPSSAEETALLRQWLEYCICVANFSDSQPSALKDLNDILAKRSYLIGHRLSAADVIFYYVLYPVLALMSMQDKERLCHLTRWFSTVQHYQGLRDTAQHKLLTFSRNSLY